jgi:hypothetical protein
MNRFIFSFVFVLFGVLPKISYAQNVADEIIGPGLQVYTYTNAPVPEEIELKDVQVPIPRSMRVLNTKGCCVWSSAEVLAYYAELKALYGITKDVRDGGDRYTQGGASSGNVKYFFAQKKIKYEMIVDKSNTAFLVRGCKIERRGVAFGIRGHMLNLVHYDPETKIVKVIDNADRSLSVQTWTWEKFHNVWSGWAYIIYAEPDIIPFKYVTLPNWFPIVNRNEPPFEFSNKYILSPTKEE